ncbi:anti-phage dCTP deaminase [Pseudocolwellia sp. HL-MZ19]|uniref:anti-phage dCTP deaminase n=1 Tax=Pseudocolwellia sp. HL-MZ19 TaxID=3400846 RepID=UPI003CECA7D8
MAEPAENITQLPIENTSLSTSDNPLNKIKQRRSQELIIGLCGAVGSGVKGLKDILANQLTEQGYIVEHVRLSDLIIDYLPNKTTQTNLTGFNRYEKLQDWGDDLRTNHGNSILAQLAIRKITILRETRFGGEDSSEGIVKVTKKVAYIIDQVKHPSEIELFKEAYRNNFYLLGLLRTENERRSNLKEELMSDAEVGTLIDRDRKASQPYGQQVEKSLHQSDYFIRNTDVAEKINKSVVRFIKLVHGLNHITPTNDETGVYAAHAASLRSACLSRQVGAAITDDDGNILSSGCNDVPKFGGGLYDSEDDVDKRCFNHGRRCHNDKHKEILELEIESILTKSNITNPSKLAKDIIENSKAKSLIEYSRAIHAEMDAITALARSSNNSTVGKTLYCTTYPCHICARHIVASGIKRVVYIEPYEKSLATQLHGDAIYHPDNRTEEKKVLFENFEGVSPIRYSKFFSYNQKRKDSKGEIISYTVLDSGHVDPQHLDSYGEYELKIVDMVNAELPD